MEDKYEGELFQGQRQGRGTQIYYNKSSYTGEWKNDEYHGSGKLIYPKKDRFQRIFYEGNFKNNEFDGFGVFQSQNQIYRGEWSSGAQSGKGELYELINSTTERPDGGESELSVVEIS